MVKVDVSLFDDRRYIVFAKALQEALPKEAPPKEAPPKEAPPKKRHCKKEALPKKRHRQITSLQNLKRGTGQH